MIRNAKNKKQRPRAASDILHGLKELAGAIEAGIPVDKRFTVRTVGIPEPGQYARTALKRLRAKPRLHRRG